MAFLGQEEQVREFQDRFKYLYLAVALCLIILLSRLVYLQVLSGEKMRYYSEENRIKRVKIAAPRGMVFDRKRRILLDNHPAFDLEIIPQYLKESKRQDEVINRVAKLIKMPAEQIRETLVKARTLPTFMPVKIKNDLTRDEVAIIQSWKIDMPGVQIQEEIKRTNVYADVASHLLGYIGEVNQNELPRLNEKTQRYKLGDSIGKFGLEQKMEDWLRGVDGERIVEVDALGRTKRNEKDKGRVLAAELEKPAVPGKNLVLTIDQDLQLAAREAFGEKIGAIVAIDPNSGAILAMLSRPSFDPTEFSRGIPPALWNKLLANENRPLRDKTIQDHYPPGSTFKLITAVAGLQEGVINENTIIHCPGKIKLGNRTYHCHEKHGHGNVNIVTAIKRSCDIFFYRVAQKLKSVDDIAKWATYMGLGRRTGINLPREVSGLIPTEAWKMKRFNEVWNAGESLSVAIGQSYVLVTGLQLANLYASVANGGTLYRPYMIHRIESNEGQAIKEFEPEIVEKHDLAAKTVSLVKQGLWGVVNDPRGTAYRQRLPGMDFVGKSGTVQVMRQAANKIYTKCETMRFRDRHNAVFAGYAPADDPKIAVAVILEHGCGGSTNAGPIVRAVIKTYLEKNFPAQYGPEVIAAKLKAEGKKTYDPPIAVPAASDEDEGIVPIEGDSLLPDDPTDNLPAPLPGGST